MDYNSTGSSLARLNITKELLCAAQCANHFPTCNIAVFNGSAIYQCSLFSELLLAEKLIMSSNAVVYDFQLSKFQGTKQTEDQHRSLYVSHIFIQLDFMREFVQKCSSLATFDNHNIFPIFSRNYYYYNYYYNIHTSIYENH